MAYPISTHRPTWQAALALMTASAAACGRDPLAPQSSLTMTIRPDSAVIAVGEQVQFTALVTDRRGRVNAPVAWTVDHPDVASVSADGLVTGITGGETRISATAGNLARSATVRVRPRTVAIRLCGGSLGSSTLNQVALALCPDSIDVPPGWQAPLVPFAITADGDSTSAIGPITWEIEDTTIATVGPGAAQLLWAVRGMRPGRTTIRVLADGLAGQAVATVRPRPAHLTVAVRTPRGPVVIESWAFDQPGAETLVGGQFPIKSPTSLDLMYAGLEWSPDGRELLYSSGANELSVLARDRSSVWTFAAPADGAYTPTWESDGIILFSTRTGELRRIIFRQGSTLSQTAPVLTEPAWYVRPGPDGELLYGCEMEDPFYPYSASSICVQDGQGRRILEACGSNPDWSPDAMLVASVCGNVTLTPTARGAKRIALYLPGGPAFGTRWAPDGRSLAVVTWGGSLWMVDVDGKRPIYRFPSSGKAVAVAWQP